MTSSTSPRRPALAEDMPSRSLWEAAAQPCPSCPPLVGAEEVEVAIVGAGYAGLSTALHLAERGVSVSVVEMGEPGNGASGANGGQVIPGLRHFVEDLQAVYGADLGQRLHSFGAGTADTAFSIIARHGIACDAMRTGWINAADSEASLAQGRRRLAAWQSLGAPVRWLERGELEAATGSRAYLGGWIDERGGSVQPLSLARGLAVASISRGVRIHGHSPVLSVTRHGAAWRVATPKGRVEARSVLIATNALTGAFWPGLKRAILPVWSFQVATRPLGAGSSVLPDGPVVSDSRRVLRYFRRDRDHRLIVGGKGTLSGPRGPSSYGVQRRMLERLYPSLKDEPIEFRWGGRIAIATDRLPRLFKLGDGVLASFADNGKGVAWNMALGSVLAEALTGTPLDALPLPHAVPLTTIPLHALHKAYVGLGSLWLRAGDWWEHARGN